MRRGSWVPRRSGPRDQDRRVLADSRRTRGRPIVFKDDRAGIGDARAGSSARRGASFTTTLRQSAAGSRRNENVINKDRPHHERPNEFTTIKSRQQTAWASGDYAVIGTTLQIVGEQLAEACDLRWDEQVLDVAAGNGNATLAAARRGCRVTSTDYVATLLDRGAERARAERLQVTFQVADVEALPSADASFDVVMSTFGVMFAPGQAKAAAEIARVCRPGGRIGLANWTPDGFIGQMFKVLVRHLPPPAGLQPPSLWGVEAHVQNLFGHAVASLTSTRAVGSPSATA